MCKLPDKVIISSAIAKLWAGFFFAFVMTSLISRSIYWSKWRVLWFEICLYSLLTVKFDLQAINLWSMISGVEADSQANADVNYAVRVAQFSIERIAFEDYFLTFTNRYWIKSFFSIRGYLWNSFFSRNSWISLELFHFPLFRKIYSLNQNSFSAPIRTKFM